MRLPPSALAMVAASVMFDVLPSLYEGNYFRIAKSQVLRGLGVSFLQTTPKARYKLLGLPSNGLHTNGYSLARKVLLNEMQLDLSAKVEGVARPIGAELLRIHRNYQPLLASIPNDRLKGAAHITGGGLVDNIPRILPAACDALIKSSSWSVPAIFRVIQRSGAISTDEMYEVFNMGIGMVLVVSKVHVAEVVALSKGKVIGQVTPGSGKLLLN